MGTNAPSPETVRWAVDAVRGRDAVDVEELRVGSTAVHLLRYADDHGAEAALVLRRFVDATRLLSDPWYVPAHEAAALDLVAAAPLDTPLLRAADVEAVHCDAPTLLTTRLPGVAGDARGGPVTEAMLVQLAVALPAIHDTAPDDAGLPAYAPYYPATDLQPPDWSGDPKLWQRVAAALRDQQPSHVAARLIHRDYHPGNTLWVGEDLAGVIDWTTACIGPPGIDLARMRQNLALDHGPGAAHAFLDVYNRETGRDEDRHPWWDLLDAADMLADMPAPRDGAQAERLERWERYVAGVTAEL